MVEVNEGHRPVAGDDVVVVRQPDPGAALVDPRPGRRHAAPRRRRHLRRARCARRSPALVPALAQAARTVGSPQIRNAATLGGNLATCSPAGDGLPVLAALDAVVELAERRGRAPLPFGEFMVGVKRTALTTRRADRRRHRAVARRLAGLRQGRRAQRDGDRHLRGVPGRRRPVPVGAHRPRFGRPDDRAGSRRRGIRRRRGRLGGAVDRAPTRWSSSVAWPRRRAARSTTTGRRRRTAATRSRSWPGDCCAGRSPSTGPRSSPHERAVPTAGQRGRPRCGRRLARREPAVRAARAARAVRRQGSLRAGGVRSCSVLVDGELVCSCLVLAAGAVACRS